MRGYTQPTRHPGFVYEGIGQRPFLIIPDCGRIKRRLPGRRDRFSPFKSEKRPLFRTAGRKEQNNAACQKKRVDAAHRLLSGDGRLPYEQGEVAPVNLTGLIRPEYTA